MSHFTTGIFVKATSKERALEEIDNLLAPYDENLDVPQLLTKEAIIAERKAEIEQFKTTRYAEYRNDPEAYLKNFTPNRRADILDNMERYWPQQFLLTDEDIYEQQLETDYEDLEITDDGSIITLYNPKSKWDWCVIGGRWNDIVPLKDGTFGNMGLVSDIDFGVIDSRYQEACSKWDETMASTDAKLLYQKRWLADNYVSKEDYALDHSTLSTFSFITPDGKWFEKGHMGWFGMSDKTPESEQTYDENWNLAIHDYTNCYFILVDCHI